ncbi:sugar ABC transporter substrate-binding protein [Candidatus Villigracilis saccharophilus]|uniref:ABC transporter substrate-binding protein n=1 Tax=Candidatus Villigracilis saccharophilus TaxID=3140684 RepID=UPI003135EFB3|nr:sugar ABC transporter substrate-binding protein [Anaerolineales bacterium]
MKLSKLFAVLVVLSMLLTACGQAAPTTAVEAPAATDAPAAEVPAGTEAPVTEPVNLTLSFWGSDLDTQVYQERVNMFMEKNPDIKVELMYIPSDYSQKVQTMIAGGTAPDIIQLSEDVHSYSSKGQVISLNDFVTKDSLDLKARYGETGGLTTAYSLDGNLYAMPDRGGALILYYNKDMFDTAGVSYPTKDWTWVEFLDATQKLTIRDGDTVTQYGFAAGGWWPWWMSFIYMNGGAILDASGQPVANSPEAVEAIQFYNDLVYKYQVAPSPEDYANLGTNSPDPLFAQGKVAMSTTGFWGIGGLKDATFNWDISPLFKNKNNATVVFGSGLAISKDCKNPEAAWKLIEFLTSEEGQAPIVEFKQDAPANIANLSGDAFLNQSWSSKPINMSALGDSANAAFALPLSPKWNEMMSVFDTNLGEVFANRAEVQPTMDVIQEQLVDLFAQ